MSGFSPSSPRLIHKFIYYLKPSVMQALEADWGHPSSACVILFLSVPSRSFSTGGTLWGAGVHAAWIYSEHRGEGREAALPNQGLQFVALLGGLLRIIHCLLPFTGGKLSPEKGNHLLRTNDWPVRTGGLVVSPKTAMGRKE